MRYLVFIFLLASQIVNAQIQAKQLKGGLPADTLFIFATDTTTGSVTKGLGKLYNAYDLINGLAVGGGGGTTNLSIGQSGGTQVIQSSSGTDVGVRNLYGLLITEGATDTLHFRVDSSLFATTYDLTQIPISSLKAAAATNTINNANYAQEWQWNTLAGVSGLKLSSNSTVAASDAQKLLEVSLSGANGTANEITYAGYFSNTHTGSGNDNYALYAVQGGSPSSNNPGAGVYGIGDFIGVHGVANGTGLAYNGIKGETTAGLGVYALGTTGIPFKGRITAGNSTINSLIYLEKFQSGSASTLTGGSIDMSVETSGGSADSILSLIARWTDKTAATRTGEFIIKLPNSATTGSKLILSGNGKLTLPDYGVGSFTSGTPVYNVLVDASGNLMEGSVPVGGTNIIEENNSSVQSANVSIDFQNPFDVATDGASEVNVSLDCGEFTTVMTIQSDDYMLMHDSGAAANEKILWSDVIIDLVSFKDDNSPVGTGNAIDVGDGLEFVMSPSTEANLNLDFGELLLDGTPEANGTEYFIVYDSDTIAGHRVQRFRYSDVVGGAADGNGIYDGDGTTPADVDVTMTDNIRFGTTTDNDFFIDGTNDRIGIGTGSPSYGLHVFNDAGCAIEASTTANIILKLEGKKDGGGANIDESTLQFSYTDADYLSGAEQTGASVILGKQSDASQWTTLKTTMNEATDADVFVAEKNAGFSNNTTESHIAMNGGIAKTQNYVWTATGADLTIDRSYYNVVVTGAGAIGDEINLPEVASNSDNWDSSLTDVQVQVGQEYTITARRNASTGLVLRPFTGDLINGQTSITLPYSANGTSVILKCNEFTAGVGYWYTY